MKSLRMWFATSRLHTVSLHEEIRWTGYEPTYEPLCSAVIGCCSTAVIDAFCFCIVYLLRWVTATFFTIIKPFWDNARLWNAAHLKNSVYLLLFLQPNTFSPFFLSDSVLHVITPPTWLLQTCVRVSTGAGNHAYSLRSPVVPYALRISLPSRLCSTSTGWVVVFTN